jgi:putative restriction endonuclease
MAKGILTTKADSAYDDVREERYHFPQNYLARVRQMEGDFFVYYEPRRNGGRSAYIATGRIAKVYADPKMAKHYYAHIDNYLEFDKPVPFRFGGNLLETSLQSEGQTGLSGDFRNAVRLLSEKEFNTIVGFGFAKEIRSEQALAQVPQIDDTPAEFHRPMVEQLVTRPFRDAAFSRQVKSAYANSCAFTGLDMRNGGGRTEVDAAHIKPVGDGHNGPDSVRNGLALSKTVHWMFDRGLLSIDSDYKILTAKGLVPEPIQRLLLPSGVISLPDDPQERPHPAFLEYHRNQIFKDAKAGA